MKKLLIVTLLIFISCGPSEEEIQSQIDEAVEKALETTTTSTTTTTLAPTTTTSTTTTLAPTTTTSTTTSTTTTTIPIPQKTVVVLEMNVDHPTTKIKDVRDAIVCGLDKNHVNKNVLQSVAVSYNSLIPPDFAFDGLETAYTNLNCASKNYSENFAGATNILKRQFTATSWFDGVRCTIEDACRIENLSLRDSSVSPKFKTDRLGVYACGAGYDPLMNTWGLFVADFVSRLGMQTLSAPAGCLPLSIEYQQSNEYASKLSNSNRACEYIADGPFRISKITIDNLYNYFRALTEKQADVCYGIFYTNFTNQTIKDNLEILKDDVNNIEAARNIEKELLSNNVIIPLYIMSDESIKRSFDRYIDEKNALEEELKSIDSDSDRAYDINNRLTEINALLLPGEESLIFYTSSP